MHKATIRFSVDLKTWHLSETDISNLRAGICSDVFQEELSKRHIYTTFHGCEILNVYVKEKELIFIIQPDWNNVSIANIFAENNSYLENYLYESVVVNLIGIGKNINSQAKLKELGETIKEMPTALPFVGVKINPSNSQVVGYYCPYIDCKQEFRNIIIKKGIRYCPHCNKPVVLLPSYTRGEKLTEVIVNGD